MPGGTGLAGHAPFGERTSPTPAPPSSPEEMPSQAPPLLKELPYWVGAGGEGADVNNKDLEVLWEQGAHPVLTQTHLCHRPPRL